MAAEKTV